MWQGIRYDWKNRRAHEVTFILAVLISIWLFIQLSHWKMANGIIDYSYRRASDCNQSSRWRHTYFFGEFISSLAKIKIVFSRQLGFRLNDWLTAWLGYFSSSLLILPKDQIFICILKFKHHQYCFVSRPLCEHLKFINCTGMTKIFVLDANFIKCQSLLHPFQDSAAKLTFTRSICAFPISWTISGGSFATIV